MSKELSNMYLWSKRRKLTENRDPRIQEHQGIWEKKVFQKEMAEHGGMPSEVQQGVDKGNIYTI